MHLQGFSPRMSPTTLAALLLYFCWLQWSLPGEIVSRRSFSRRRADVIHGRCSASFYPHGEWIGELLRTCSALLFSGKAFLCWREQRREPKATEVRRLGKGAFKTFFAAFMWTEKERHCFPTTFQLVIINLLSSEIVIHLPLKLRKRFAAQRKWS